MLKLRKSADGEIFPQYSCSASSLVVLCPQCSGSNHLKTFKHDATQKQTHVCKSLNADYSIGEHRSFKLAQFPVSRSVLTGYEGIKKVFTL